MMTAPVRKAVFPIAGLGTRFLPATKTVAKEMLPVVDRPLIQYGVEEALAAGIEEMIFVMGSHPSGARDHFRRAGELNAVLEARGKREALEAVNACVLPDERLHVVHQDAPLGLGHAVWCARDLVGDGPFAVILPDDLVTGARPCLAQMTGAYAETGGNLVAVMDVPRAHTSRYGILDIGEAAGNLVAIKGLVEKPDPADAPSTLSVIGRYILQPEIFSHLAAFEKGAGGEIQLTDAMAKLIGVQPFHGLRFEGTRFDCGNKLGFLEANIAVALERPDMRDQTRRLLAAYGGGG